MLVNVLGGRVGATSATFRGWGGVRHLREPRGPCACGARHPCSKMTSTSGNHDTSKLHSSVTGARWGGREKRSSKQPHPPQTMRLVPEAYGALRELAMTATQGQPRTHRPRRPSEHFSEDGLVLKEVDGYYEEAAEEEEEREEEEEEQQEEFGEVQDVEDSEEEEDTEDEDNGNVRGGTSHGEVDDRRSQVVGVRWNKSVRKWEAGKWEVGPRRCCPPRSSNVYRALRSRIEWHLTSNICQVLSSKVCAFCTLIS